MLFISNYIKPLVAVALLFFQALVSAQGGRLPDSILRKVAPGIHKTSLKSTEYSYRVLAEDPKKFTDWLEQEYPNVLVQPTKYSNVLNLKHVDAESFNAIINHNACTYIDFPDRTVVEERYIRTLDLSVNWIERVHKDYLDVDGEGLVVSIKERPFDTSDIDFHHRVLKPGKGQGRSTGHATDMATVIAGGGNSGDKGLGVAPKVHIVTSGVESLLPEESHVLKSEGVAVQNHSYGIGRIENYYGIESQLYDKQCNEQPELVHVFSSGNIGNTAANTGRYTGVNGYANLTGQFKTSKNSICVGGTGDNVEPVAFSSKGPAYDGRVKPEVVAYGAAGTSDASALVSGVVTLLQDYYIKKFQEFPSSTLVKAVLVNSAKDIMNKGVDYITGYGAVNAYRAIKTIEEERFMDDTLEIGGFFEYNMKVPENSDMVKITLAWNDPFGEVGNDKALVNDLDLELTNINNGKTYYPWVLNTYPHIDSLNKEAVRAVDTLNNLEQITIDKPEAGTYKIVVRGSKMQTQNQAFNLAYCVREEGLIWNSPNSGSQLTAGEEISLRWNWTGGDQMAKIEYRIAGSEEWKEITNSYNLKAGSVRWTLPEINSIMNVRVSSQDILYEVDSIIVSGDMTLQVGFNCEEDVMLSWNKQEGVDEYWLWQLEDDGYMKKRISVPDTIYQFTKDDATSPYFAVSPVIENKDGKRAITKNYAEQGVNCYLISFYPLQNATKGIVQFNLEVASVYELENIVLERLKSGVFEEVEVTKPNHTLNYLLSDEAPLPQKNIYRVKFIRKNNKEAYSAEEVVYFVNENNLFLYPNPVYGNSEGLYLISSDERLSVTIYDLSGKPIMETGDLYGQIRLLEIAGLEAGIYILRAKNQNEKEIIKKFMIVK